MVFGKELVYLFDPHSRGSLGEPVANGFSVLVKFKNVTCVQKYMATFNVANSPTPVPFEIQFVKINSSVKEMSHLQTCLCKIPVPFTLIETRDYTVQSNVPSIETNLFHTCQESVTKLNAIERGTFIATL